MIFANEYLVDLNATRAYKVAYKNIKKDETARVNASRLLTNANVKTYIDEQLKKIESEKIADAKEVMEYLSRILRDEEKEETLIGEGGGVQSKTNIKLSAKDKLKAAELLGKRYGMFTDKIDMEVDSKVVIVDDI